MSTSVNKRWSKTNNSRYYSIMDQYLRDNGLRRKSIARDGCCLFRAVAEQVYLTQTTHWELRRMCAAYIKRNPSRFKSFMTIAVKEYCWKLSNCNLWGGHMELVALSELLQQEIVIYQEQDGRITTQTISPTKSTTKPEILLVFTGNNHYDSLWRSEEETATAICQSILYELLIETVMKTKVPPSDLRSAIRIRGSDFNTRTFSMGIINRYPDDFLRGLSCQSYFNIPFRVWKRDKEANEKADRRLAAAMQFTIGDQCVVSHDGKQYTGDIVSGLSSSKVEVFVKDLHKRIKVPVGEIMLNQRTQHHMRGQPRNGSKGHHYQKTGVSGKGENTTAAAPRRSYIKNGKSQSRQDRHQRPPHHSYEKKEAAAAPKLSDAAQDTTLIPPPPLPSSSSSQYEKNEETEQQQQQKQDLSTVEKLSRENLAENGQQQLLPSTVGFSDTTVRMSSLMGRGHPLEIFNQASLASITEAPESEWPILHAGGGSHPLGNIFAAAVAAGSNPQRCHLDGPPPPPVNPPPPPMGLDQPPQLPFPVYSHDPLRFLIQEMNPPVHLLKSGTAEGRQQFMYEFAQNSLRFYSKYVSDPELEDTLNELLCMEFEEFLSAHTQRYRQGDFSVGTSVTSREGSQLDIREHSHTLSDNSEERHTPRVSEEDRTSSDTSPVEPKHQEEADVTLSSSSHIPPRGSTHEGLEVSASPTEVNLEKEEDRTTGGVSPVIPSGSGSQNSMQQQQENLMGMGPFQPPMMFPPGTHPPYGFPYPMMFPGPMFPWGYYPPMGGAAFMVPPHMLPPHVRGMPMMSPTNEEGGAGGVSGSDDNIEVQKSTGDINGITGAPDQEQPEDTPTSKHEEGPVDVPRSASSSYTQDETEPKRDMKEIAGEDKSTPQQQENSGKDGGNESKSKATGGGPGKNLKTRSFTRGGQNQHRQYGGGYRRNNNKYYQQHSNTRYGNYSSSSSSQDQRKKAESNNTNSNGTDSHQ